MSGDNNISEQLQVNLEVENTITSNHQDQHHGFSPYPTQSGISTDQSFQLPRRPLPPLPNRGPGPKIIASKPLESPSAHSTFQQIPDSNRNSNVAIEQIQNTQRPSPPIPTPMASNSAESSLTEDQDDRGLFRFKAQQKVPLTIQGNLVVEVPVPQKLLAGLTHADINATHLRYSAVCADPDTFQQEGYTLRQAEQGLTTEIFIVVTMYNESHDLFMRTWSALVSNIQYMCSKKNSSFWDKDGWKKIVICIVSDGRAVVNRKTLAVLGLLGAYQEGLLATQIESRKVDAHLFEYTSHVNLDSEYKMKPPADEIPPVL